MSKDDYLNRKIKRQFDEIKALGKIHEKDLSKNETWKEVKKVSRYFKSSLYAIKSLDNSSQSLYNSDSPDGEV